MTTLKVKLKIKTSIIFILLIVIFIIIAIIMLFQYKLIYNFALFSTQKDFVNLTNKVINRIENYDKNSVNFIKLIQNIPNISKPISLKKEDILLPVSINYMTNQKYVYGIYLGFKNNNFYIVYNLNVSKTMKKAQRAPKNAQWLVVKNITKNGKIYSYRKFLDKNLHVIKIVKFFTTYKPTLRPWYKEALKSNTIIKTPPYIFASIHQPGITYAKLIDKSKGVVLALDITLNSFNRLLKTQHLIKGSAAFLFNKNGTVIAQFNQITNKKITNLKTLNFIFKNNHIPYLDKEVIIDINGKEYIKYVKQLDSHFKSKNYLAIISPLKPIIKPYLTKIYNTLLISLIILIIIIFPAMLFIVKFIATPIMKLEKETHKIIKGDFENIKPINSFILEIESLSNSFVKMANFIRDLTKNLEKKVIERTKDLQKAKKKIEEIHQHTKESIEYASLIQHSLIPDNNLFKKYFKDFFVIWQPKDIVGGDIYLFNELKTNEECLIMCIDCTGHGVPGAFLTMLVKAISTQIVAEISNNTNEINTATILSMFNKSMKKLLKQENKNNLSNVGFDGGIIYYNKKEKIIKFSGANTPLFYIDENKQLKTIKGSRYSVGYKKCDINYNYKEHTIQVKDGMKFYITTDGFLDQNGGEKGFPFGKKRFKKIIEENYSKPMKEQKHIFLETLAKYQGNNERNDDITLIGFEI